MIRISDFFARETDFPQLDIPGCVQRLSAAVQCKTINDGKDYSEFERIHALIKESFPHVIENGRLETVGHSILIELPGLDQTLKPCLFMSHLDVVPVVEGTEAKWTFPAFSGAVADGYIWGRGTLDIKNQVFGILEAIEFILAQGKTPERKIYFAFGEDEETFNTGAQAISDLLMSRGVTLEFVLDEGLNRIQSGDIYGAPGVYTSIISLMEKGYADLELSVSSIGGHSSCPFGGTSLGQLSKAIANIVNAPFPATLSPVAKSTFSAVAPYVTEEPLKTLLQDIDGNTQEIAEYCTGIRELFPYVTTTIAPTMIRGSSAACNVMPQDMSAVINFRISYGQTVQDIMSHCRNAVDDPLVSMRFIQANNPSSAARTDSYGYQKLLSVLNRYHRNIVFLPGEVIAATDARCYEQICDTCLRCSPFIVSKAEADRGVHGTDERIPISTYMHGIRILICFMEDTCF